MKNVLRVKTASEGSGAVQSLQEGKTPNPKRIVDQLDVRRALGIPLGLRGRGSVAFLNTGSGIATAERLQREGASDRLELDALPGFEKIGWGLSAVYPFSYSDSPRIPFGRLRN